ncbi:WD repeat-containing protein 24 [Toxocara canis]|uniref:GATOR2 complex protein WDR24 n=1 Tax=Toxocara canis TaxID=6265 RepID=A0A0B2VYD6_TOXCA|nr:WD repeat-containing protein 24 [Toxocara canis]
MKNARRNIRIDLQEQVDALSSNRDNTRLVAAGSKGLMKIFSTENSTLSVVADLRPVRTRKLNLMYSASHVAWSPVVDNLVATTSTNGAVVLWDVEKGALERIYKAHNRSATKVCFHRIDRNTFISGAKDAIVAQYDLRSPTFAQKFISGSFDPVRDIQFGLHFEQMDIFVSADDGGSVRFWDLRRNDRPLKQFVAHHGPASVALNPSYDDRNLIATAGRDKFIRIWKWSDWSDGGTNSAIYSVESTTPVARVQWRPQHKYQVSSCAVVNDINIYIWDIRRPFLPFASFDDHRDMCSDMIWNPEVDDSFVTAAKDGLIVMHYFENAHYPLAYVNDIAVDVSPSGEIVIALSDQLKLKNEALTDKEKLEKGEAVPPRRRKYDPFQSWTHSSLIRCVPRAAQKALCPDNFIRLAQNYKLSGGELEVLCDYNSQVAESIGSCQVAHTWRMLSLLCSLSPFFDPSSSKRNSSSEHRPSHQSGESEEVVTRSRFSSSRSSGGAMRNADGSDEVMGCLFATCVPPTLSETADFYFGDAELNTAGLASDLLDVNMSCRLDSSPFLRMEAFLPRPCDELETLEETRSMSSEEASSSSFSSTADESDTSMEQYYSRIGRFRCFPMLPMEAFLPRPCDELETLEETRSMSSEEASSSSFSSTADESDTSMEQYYSRIGGLSVSVDAICPPPWDPLPMIQSMFMQYAEVGDVQTCVSILLVLGEKTVDLVDISVQKLWFLDYLEMLECYELWNTCAEVIKLCWIPSVSALSRESTFLRLVCQKCKAVSTNVSPICKKCLRKFNFTCAVCAMPVRGVWGWCRECRHGGHPEHLAQWFSTDSHCPTGCGHLCVPANRERDSRSSLNDSVECENRDSSASTACEEKITL